MAQTTPRSEVKRPSVMTTLGCSVLSGILISLSMPNFNQWPLAWIAFVPLLTALQLRPAGVALNLYILPCCLLWSLSVHVWYIDLFGQLVGWLLIIGVGFFYMALIGLGVTLSERLPAFASFLAPPVTWTALEWIRSAAPLSQGWWFVLLAQSQWNFPPALQILSVTGFAGLSFTLMLTNAAFAQLLADKIRRRGLNRAATVALGSSALVVVVGALVIPRPPEETITVAATTDWAFPPTGHWKSDDERRDTIFAVNAQLTDQVMRNPDRPQFVVWPERFSHRLDLEADMAQLRTLAEKHSIHVVAHVVWPVGESIQEHFAGAVLISPDGKLLGRQAKIHPAPGESTTAGPKEYPVFDTTHGKVGLLVCYDSRFAELVRNLARNGSRLLFMPADDSLQCNNRWLPGVHAADVPLRAVENRVAFATSTTSGTSTLCDPYGRVIGQGDLNTRGVIVGQVFTTEGPTLYTRFGDWFGLLITLGLLACIGFVRVRDRRATASTCC